MPATVPRRDRLPLPLTSANWLILLFIVAAMLLPMLNVLAVSFSTNVNSEVPGLVLFPRPLSFEGYQLIWSYMNLWRPLLNTVYVSTVGTLIHVLLSCLGGYILIQRDLPFRKLMTSFILLTMTIPSELTLVAIYAVNKQYHLINTYAGLIVNGAASGFSILLMRNYFLNVPSSLAEAARIDATPEYRIFWKIFMRLSRPGVITIATLQLISRWNNISTVVTLISDLKKTTLPVILRWLLFDQATTSGLAYIFANAKMAAVIITAVPLVIVYFAAQRYFVAGAFIGSVKG